jgi:DNA polymerase-3 subunit gamma/tau
VRQLQHLLQGGAAPPRPAPAPAPATAGAPVALAPASPTASAIRPAVQEAPQPETAPVAEAAPEAPALADPKDFRELVQLFADRREGALYGQLYGSVHLVRMEPGQLEIRLKDRTQSNFAGRIGSLLTEWTGRRWMVGVSGAPGQPTLLEQDRSAEQAALQEAGSHPVVRAVLDAFPGARIERTRGFGDSPPAAGDDLAGAAGEDDLMDMQADPADMSGDISSDMMDEEGAF